MREELMKRRHGFTLIELLIVVVIIGILAAIAIPKFSSTREKAFVSAMKSDLRNLETAQEIYYSDGNYSYVAGTADPDNPTLSPLGFTVSDAVTVTVGIEGDGWYATATHEALTDQSCDVFAGIDATTNTTHAEQPGVVACGTTTP